jgi:hypothetical protein
MRRAPALLVALLALAPPALAADGGSSLLSGYGGPGDGEQAILGQQIYAPKTKSSGATRRTPTPRAPSPTAIYAPAAPAAAPSTPATAPASARPPATKAKARVRRHRSAHLRSAATRRRSARAHRIAVVPNTPAPVVVRPSSAPSPLGGSALALAVGVLVVLLGLGLAARRLAVLSAMRRRGPAHRPTAYAARPGQAP